MRARICHRMEMPPAEVPQCDMSAIAFPTDAISLGEMRRRDPQLFTRQALRDDVVSDSEVLCILGIEMKIAEKAFARGLGRADPYPRPEDQRDVLAEELNWAYCEFGLSTGMQATRELLRQVEAAAEAQADRIRGNAR